VLELKNFLDQQASTYFARLQENFVEIWLFERSKSFEYFVQVEALPFGCDRIVHQGRMTSCVLFGPNSQTVGSLMNRCMLCFCVERSRLHDLQLPGLWPFLFSSSNLTSRSSDLISRFFWSLISSVSRVNHPQ